MFETATHPALMFNHLSLSVIDFDRSLKFYDGVLPLLGYPRQFMNDPADGYRERVASYSPPGQEDGFAIRHRPAANLKPDDGFHIAFDAPSHAAVDAFYEAALKLGGRDNGPAGFHPDHGENYYAAFVFDPDGYRIEAVCRSDQ
ncbi:MAG: VOC family protein [Synoicihabitans sp.]